MAAPINLALKMILAYNNFTLFNRNMLLAIVYIFLLSNLASGSHLTVERKLEKSGFHREIHTTFEVPSIILPSSSDVSSCQILFTEFIPPGAYVDAHQLASLKDFGGPDFLLTAHVDVEQPEFNSIEFSLHIFMSLEPTTSGWQAIYSVPVHMRYHAVSYKSFSKVSFIKPEVAIRCNGTEAEVISKEHKDETLGFMPGPCDSSGEKKCDWLQLKYYYSDMKNLQSRVPNGKKQHTFIVTMGTLTTTLIGCVILGFKTVYKQKKLESAADDFKYSKIDMQKP